MSAGHQALLKIAEFWANFAVRTPLYLWLGAFATGLLLEHVLPRAEEGHSFSGYWRNFWHTGVILVVIYLWNPIAATIMVAIVRWIDHPPLFDLDVINTASWHGAILAALLSVLISDFFIYWWHRGVHVIHWLWDEHSVHHSDEELNSFSGARIAWIDMIFQLFTVVLPGSLLFKLSPSNAFIIAYSLGGWTMFNHFNIRLSLGPLAYVITGPQYHRIHHSVLP